MSRRVDRAPVALTSDGVLLINVATFDEPRRLEALFKAAQREPGRVFVGVPASEREVTFILRRLFDASYEAASICTGTRRRGRARRR